MIGPARNRLEILSVIACAGLVLAGFFVWQPFMWVGATLTISIARYLRSKTTSVGSDHSLNKR